MYYSEHDCIIVYRHKQSGLHYMYSTLLYTYNTATYYKQKVPFLIAGHIHCMVNNFHGVLSFVINFSYVVDLAVTKIFTHEN